MTQRANGVWYYQRRIPLASQPFFQNKQSLKVSPKTKSIAEARVKARQLSVEHDTLFAQHEQAASRPNTTKRLTHNPFESLIDIKEQTQRLSGIAKVTADNLVGT
ncbi:recombinase, partial [Vibrio fluvialis]|nr:recombinase [Vibrio fluvialis]